MKNNFLTLFKKNRLFPEVQKIAARLEHNGYKAWLAGGCVRDAWLGLTPHDFDIATNAMPEQIESLYEKTVAVGRQFGVIKVVTRFGDVEVATFRKDKDYKDGRHPEGVEFSEPQEDALRRDFTINGLFYDLKTHQIHDYVEGAADLKNKLIRTIGNPDDRFNEDKLRILRALRFVSQLGFKIESETFRAVERMRKEVHQVSGERLFDELGKFFKGSYFLMGFPLLNKTGILNEIFPTLKVNSTLMGGLKNLERSKLVDLVFERWLIIFYGIRDIKEREILYSRFKSSRDFQNRIENSIKLIGKIKRFPKLTISDKKKMSADQHIENALHVAHALGNKDLKIAGFVKKNKKLPRPLINSQLLLKAGISPGPGFGDLLDQAFDAQLEGKIRTKTHARNWLAKRVTK